MTYGIGAQDLKAQRDRQAKEAARIKTYLDYLKGGKRPNEAAEALGINWKTLRNMRRNNPDFREAEQHALSFANEMVEKVLFERALDGDTNAIKIWLQAHEKARYGVQQQVNHVLTVEADDDVRAMLGDIAKVRAVLESRREQAALPAAPDDGIIDAEVVDE